MGDGYEVLVAREVREVLDQLDEKSERIVRENLGKLDEPYPGEGQGDKEKLTRPGAEPLYRLHVGRTWTAFYRVRDDEREVRVLDLMTIDEAHKRYGRFE